MANLHTTMALEQSRVKSKTQNERAASISKWQGYSKDMTGINQNRTK